MKHGINQRKLGRMPAHRIALLRNLVSALLHHETIKTTLPKAKEAARMAEKPPHNSPSPIASSSSSSSSLLEAENDDEHFVPPKSLLPKLFDELSLRYAERPGGYTRIHKFGRRQGDNAPHAIVTLVDGPRDLKFEMLAREVGKSSLDLLEQKGGKLEEVGEGWEGLKPRTRLQVEKVLKYKSEGERREFKVKAKEFADYIQAEESAYGGVRSPNVSPDTPAYRRPGMNTPKTGRLLHAGERLSGVSTHTTGLGLARGALARTPRGRQNVDKSPRFWGQARLPEGVSAEVV
uniref:Ribosomal protein L17 n=1 Tax=Kwoniella bestiolae CBS 10118 TaxID=1296100 RepID=A0A1B9G011_9TREE|nr:ribosomal protein L17 [Kwoniella bestiolae CBS 10118]OCF24358.1 ribosomal protein L17 [Kwoniella bestiolae CBS 10118]